MTTPAYLSTAEAAAHLGMTVGALRMAIHRGHIRPTGCLGQRLLFTKDDLDAQVRGATLDPRPVHSESCAAQPVDAFVDEKEHEDEESRTEDSTPRCAESWQKQLPRQGDGEMPEDGEALRERKEDSGRVLSEAADLQLQLKRRLVEEMEAGEEVADPIQLQSRLSNDMTFADYAERWIVHVEKTGRKRPHVVDTDAYRAEVHLLPLIGHLYVDDIGKPELAMWMKRVPLIKREDGKPYAKETLRAAWRLLSTMLRDAELLIGVKCDAPNNMRFRVDAPAQTKKPALTRSELSAMLAGLEFESPDIAAMIWVQATTGMRFGEVSALTWDDVDFDKGLLHVRRSQVEGKVYPTKTSTSRTVPMFPEVRRRLLAHREWLDDKRWKREDGVVFPSRNGSFRTSTMTRKPLDRCCARAGIDKHVTNQTLRRTVNNLIRQHAGEIAARAITGHATQDMTEHYSDVTMEEKMRAGAGAFGRIIDGERELNDRDPDASRPRTGPLSSAELDQIDALFAPQNDDEVEHEEGADEAKNGDLEPLEEGSERRRLRPRRVLVGNAGGEFPRREQFPTKVARRKT